MEKVKLSKEELAAMGITNERSLKIYLDFVNKHRRANGEQEMDIKNPFINESEMAWIKSLGVKADDTQAKFDEEARTAVLKKYPEGSNISQDERNYLEYLYKTKRK